VISMIVSVFIVTYRSPVDLKNNIASILESGADVTVNVINNHSDFELAPEHKHAVTVLHNQLRPDFSTGHLARNWNQALLLGFRNLKNPASDIVVTVQDDVLFKPDWLRNLIELHRKYSFITMGAGDAFCSYLPEAVRTIGLWDERFCNIGCHEADYFLRALIYNRDLSSINDIFHGRVHNAVGANSCTDFRLFDAEFENEQQRANSLLITVPRIDSDRRCAHLASAKFHRLVGALFRHKWNVHFNNWTEEHHSLRNSLVHNYLMYPYFEKDVEGLREKNYIVSDDF
jgi:hypothetical protein